MSGGSSIEWTDATWNPVRGCSRVSAGCKNCYAERHAARFSDEGVETNDVDGNMRGALPFAGFAKQTPAGPRWTGEVALMPHLLDWPLRKRKPLRIFVNSMSDLFHEKLDFDAGVRPIFEVMASAPHHTFQILTKRPKRAREYFASTSGCWSGQERDKWAQYPLPNVWLGTSVENQATADERIPHLLATPAAKRFVSYEPALGPVDFRAWLAATALRAIDGGPALDWLIVGGESGHGARPFDIAWARSTVEQCKIAGVACFVKQMGARPYSDAGDHVHEDGTVPVGCFVDFEDRKGGDWNEWPEDLRVREFPR